MIGRDLRSTVSTSVPAACLGVVMVVAGCSSLPPSHVEPPPTASGTQPAPSTTNPEVDVRRGEFTANASMLDTWNAIGQILVRLDGVHYEGRAQMLGIYSVRYRGERFLILTGALMLQGNAKGMVTKVGAALLDGKPSESRAAVELLGLLEERLPAELALIAAGGRGRVRP